MMCSSERNVLSNLLMHCPVVSLCLHLEDVSVAYVSCMVYPESYEGLCYELSFGCIVIM